MKKVLLFAVIAMFLMVPMSFAKQAISEGEMAAVTAQEGVTVDFSCFTLGTISIATQAWGDGDGCDDCASAYSAAGWVGAVDITIPTITLGGTLTIDVGTSGGVTALAIGLPTLSFAGAQQQVVVLGSDVADLKAKTQILGTSYMDGLTLSPSGQLIIYAH